jgi:hypothetical protein
VTPLEPRQTSLAHAASSPIGANPITSATKVRDILIVIVIPFAVPAVVLPVVNGPASLTLTNIAFGFVAVAFAGVARAVTAKTDEWLVFSLLALMCVCFLTAFAVGDDTSELTSRLNDVVLHETAVPKGASVPAMRGAARAVKAAEPSTFHWICCLVLGVTLMLLSFELIRRER